MKDKLIDMIRAWDKEKITDYGEKQTIFLHI